jgi:hypothetical protein
VDHVDLLKLPDIRVFRNWRDAPKGALLQISFGGEIYVGMRTTYKVANGEPDALLILAGDDVGELVTDAYLSGPALDVGAELEIVACDPAPFETTNIPQLPAGALFRHLQYDAAYFVWIKLPDGHGLGRGAVCVLSDRPECPVGECYPQMDRTKLLGVAPRVAVKLRDPRKRPSK